MTSMTVDNDFGEATGRFHGSNPHSHGSEACLPSKSLYFQSHGDFHGSEN